MRRILVYARHKLGTHQCVDLVDTAGFIPGPVVSEQACSGGGYPHLARRKLANVVHMQPDLLPLGFHRYGLEGVAPAVIFHQAVHASHQHMAVRRLVNGTDIIGKQRFTVTFAIHIICLEACAVIPVQAVLGGYPYISARVLHYTVHQSGRQSLVGGVQSWLLRTRRCTHNYHYHCAQGDTQCL